MKLAIFDFDGTIFTRDTLPYLGEAWVKLGYSRLRYYLTYASILPVLCLYKAGIMNREQMKMTAMKRFRLLFAGMTRESVNRFFEQAYPGMRPHFHPTILEEIRRKKQAQYHLVLLSGAYSDLLKLVAAEFGFETCIGAQLHYGGNEQMDLHCEIAFVDGISKLYMLQQTFAGLEIEWVSSCCFGDSYDDLPILEAVGHSIAVNPDPRLRSFAVSNGWQIIECRP